MNLKKLAASAVLFMTASVSFAQGAAPIQLTLTSSGPNMLGTTFERSVTGLFVDVFSFLPPSVSGTVSVSLVPLDTSVSFFAALLNNEGFSKFPEDGPPTFMFQSIVNATVPLSLTVFGYAGNPLTLTDASGRYSGSVQVLTVTPIPEPETYALMMAGLLALGAIKRRSVRRGANAA